MNAADSVSRPQELYLELIDAVGVVNKFDGPAVAKDLRQHRDLWRAAVITREPKVTREADHSTLASRQSLIHLRDLSLGYVNLSTLFILPNPGAQEALEALVMK